MKNPEPLDFTGVLLEIDCTYGYNRDMGAKRTVEYPSWAEEWRGPGRTIRKKGDGYALYHCTTIRRPGEPPKSKQTYLGRITEKDGFIPKEGSADQEAYVEYGLSHLIWKNLKDAILKRIPGSHNAALLKLGIICFIFGSADEVFLKSSYLTYGELERLLPLAGKISQNQLQKVTHLIEEELHKKIPSETEYNMLIRLLMLCVARPGHAMKESPAVPACVNEVLVRRNLKM